MFRSPLSSEVQSTWISNHQAEVMTWGRSSCLSLCDFPPCQLPVWAAFRSWKTCNTPYTLAYLSWEMNFPQLYISNQLCCSSGWVKVISAPWERDSKPGGIRGYLQNKDRTCGGNHPTDGWEFLHCQTLNDGEMIFMLKEFMLRWKLRKRWLQQECEWKGFINTF